MPAGASPKREREYEELKAQFEKEGRYPGREEEVAARIVNKQRAEHGETKADHGGAASRSGKPAASHGKPAKSSKSAKAGKPGKGAE